MENSKNQKHKKMVLLEVKYGKYKRTENNSSGLFVFSTFKTQNTICWDFCGSNVEKQKTKPQQKQYFGTLGGESGKYQRYKKQKQKNILGFLEVKCGKYQESRNIALFVFLFVVLSTFHLQESQNIVVFFVCFWFVHISFAMVRKSLFSVSVKAHCKKYSQKHSKAHSHESPFCMYMYNVLQFLKPPRPTLGLPAPSTDMPRSQAGLMAELQLPVWDVLKEVQSTATPTDANSNSKHRSNGNCDNVGTGRNYHNYDSDNNMKRITHVREATATIGIVVATVTVLVVMMVLIGRDRIAVLVVQASVVRKDIMSAKVKVIHQE